MRSGQETVRSKITEKNQLIRKRYPELTSLKKIMPEKIQTPSQDQSLPRITHDLTNFLTMSGTKAMNLTMFAHRLWI